MNPITREDIRTLSDNLLNPEYLICVSHKTHNAIHYGDEGMLAHSPLSGRETIPAVEANKIGGKCYGEYPDFYQEVVDAEQSTLISTTFSFSISTPYSPF